MKTAAGILGIVAGVIGLLAAVLAFGLSGVASLFPASRESGNLVFIGAWLALAQPRSIDAPPPPPPALGAPPQSRFTWRPAEGQTLSLPDDLDVVANAQPNAAKTGTIPANCEFTVIVSRPGWIYVQSEDGSFEGWAQVP